MYKSRMKKTDAVQQYVSLRAGLLREKAALQARLSQIDQALRGEQPVSTPVAKAARPGKRIRNKISLKDAVTRVTRGKPLTKPEILAAIHKLGYRFNTALAVNSLNSVLYAKRQFKNENGKFSPAK